MYFGKLGKQKNPHFRRVPWNAEVTEDAEDDLLVAHGVILV
jgi:hypothetical protein